MTCAVGRPDRNGDQIGDDISPGLRDELLAYLMAASADRARIIGELTTRNPGMADLFTDLEADDELRARFEMDLRRLQPSKWFFRWIDLQPAREIRPGFGSSPSLRCDESERQEPQHGQSREYVRVVARARHAAPRSRKTSCADGPNCWGGSSSRRWPGSSDRR